MIWDVIIGLQQFLHDNPTANSIAITNSKTEIASYSVEATTDNTSIQIRIEDHESAPPTVIQAKNPFQIDISSTGSTNTAETNELETYLPYALLPYFSQKSKKCFAISHFAQTLDGRIAAVSGDSKWIGNDENLTHAHKMRALCDSIMIGANTLEIDQPRLTVRHVSGDQPIRIVIGGNPEKVSEAINGSGPVLHFVSSSNATTADTIELKQVDGAFDCHDILNYLYHRGISSVYIEGGSITTSLFMQGAALDQVQVHISPRILGSGTTGFQFDGASDISEAFSFNNPRFVSMGDQIMFIGEIDR